MSIARWGIVGTPKKYFEPANLTGFLSLSIETSKLSRLLNSSYRSSETVRVSSRRISWN